MSGPAAGRLPTVIRQFSTRSEIFRSSVGHPCIYLSEQTHMIRLPRHPRPTLRRVAARAAVFLGLAGLLGCRVSPLPDICSDCRVDDTNNFTYTADLTVASVPLAAATDNLLGWEGLTHDIHGGLLAPMTDVDEAQLIGFRDLSQAAIADGLANETLEQADVTLYVVCTPDSSTCNMSDFRIGRSGVDLSKYFLPDMGNWLLALSANGKPGAGGLLFLEPEASAPDFAHVTDASSRLDVTVDFHSLTPLGVPRDDAAVTLDWSGVATDGLGNAFQPAEIDGAYIARFDAPLDDLEVDPVDLVTRGDASYWKADVTGMSQANLAAFTNTVDPGQTFPGIDSEGTWLFALTCSSCTNPAPRFVTVLTVAEANAHP